MPDVVKAFFLFHFEHVFFFGLQQPHQQIHYRDHVVGIKDKEVEDALRYIDRHQMREHRQRVLLEQVLADHFQIVIFFQLSFQSGKDLTQ